MKELSNTTFWQAHLRLIGGCLIVWFLVSFGCGILFVDELNGFSVGNVPLGFWFAQQGAIYAFLILIVFYTWRVGKLEAQLRSSQSSTGTGSETAGDNRS